MRRELKQEQLTDELDKNAVLMLAEELNDAARHALGKFVISEPFDTWPKHRQVTLRCAAEYLLRRFDLISKPSNDFEDDA